MADKRMFSRQIVSTDVFLDLPLSAQALYYQVCLEADDDGVLSSPRKITRMIGAADKDMQALISSGFLLAVDDFIVVTHWRIHNTIQKDRYKPTIYTDVLKRLILDESKVYKLDTDCIQNVSDLDTQISIDKNRLGEDSHLSPNADDRAPKYQEILDLFNKICISLPKVEKLTANRKQRIKTASKDLNGDFSSFFQKIEESDFLTGRTGNWSGCCFDWIMKPQNFIKIIEGNYDNKSQNTGCGHHIVYEEDE